MKLLYQKARLAEDRQPSHGASRRAEDRQPSHGESLRAPRYAETVTETAIAVHETSTPPFCPHSHSIVDRKQKYHFSQAKTHRRRFQTSDQSAASCTHNAYMHEYEIVCMPRYYLNDFPGSFELCDVSIHHCDQPITFNDKHSKGLNQLLIRFLARRRLHQIHSGKVSE